MKRYEKPEIEVILVDTSIIAASIPTSSGAVDGDAERINNNRHNEWDEMWEKQR